MMAFVNALRTSAFLRFLLAGGLAAGVNIASRYVFNTVMPFEIAVVVAYLCGMTTAYVLSRAFVFEASGRSRWEEFGRFGLVNLLAAAQVWLVSVGLARYGLPAVNWTFHPHEIAHVIGVLFPVVSSYLAHKHFSFAESSRSHGP
jgi:putative flippase GtrA